MEVSMKSLIKHKHSENYMQNLQDEMNRIMDDVFGKNAFFDVATESKLWRPALEMIENENEYEIKLELPGFEKKDIDIEVGNDYISVKAENSFRKEDKKKNLYRSEFRYGNFMRTVSLPSNINPEKTNAEYHNGVLSITAAKSKQKTNIKKLEIKEAKE